MYNHYIPQSDGSYRRNAVPEPRNKPPRPAPPPEPPKPEPEKPPAPCPQSPHSQQSEQPSQSPLSFLRKLLPKDLDISDLIIIGLLLLLSSEDCEDDLSPILTIALYFLL